MTKLSAEQLRAKQLAAKCGYCRAQPGDPCRRMLHVSATLDAPATFHAIGAGPVMDRPHRTRGC